MYVERLLQINVATLAALGTLLLGMGQRSEGLPLLMLIAAIASVWLTDFTGWFRLSRKVANVAVVVAAAVCVHQLRYYGGDVRLLGIAPMLIYWQIILLFLEKDVRIYWQLIMLSLLQVVVAAAFSQGVWFGVLLVLYMLIGLSALTLLLLHRQWNRYRPALKSPPPLPATRTRWPLAGQEPVFCSTPGGRGRAGICRELFTRLGMTGLGTLVLTLLLFFTVPRFGQTAWRGALVAPRQLVGFSDEVTLGELGEIIESPEEVMRMELIDRRTGNPCSVQNELYLRGAILTHYVSNQQRRGEWRRSAQETEASRPLPKADPAQSDSLVLQRIDIEPLRQDELFCLWPFFATEATASLRFRGQRLLRPVARRAKRFRFELGTTALVDGAQAPITPVAPWETPDHLLRLLQIPQLPRLTALADRWSRQSGLPAGDRVGRARALEHKFHDPDRFQYSLEQQPRDLGIDPIEDFVSNNPRGHCEYFATALALMLRSRGIPARVVVGFRCDEFNDLGKFYQVRQWHAHAWVEAHLQRKHLPDELLQGRDSQRWARGGWLRLEPTPALGTARAGPASSIFGRIEQSLRWLESLWEDYIVEMDRQRQRAAIRKLLDPEWWRAAIQKIGKALDFTRWSRSAWLWVALVALAGSAVLWLGRRRMWRAWCRIWVRLAGRAAPAAATRQTEVEFYRRLEALLARHGLLRSPGQTQHEFAAAAGARIAAASGRPHLASLPVQVVEAFYRVRFGRLPLDNPRAQAVEHALAQLAACGDNL